MIKGIHKRLTTNATTNFVDQSIYVVQLLLSCQDAGSGGWTLRIQDRATPPAILLPTYTISKPTDGAVFLKKFDYGIYMQDGIDFVTAIGSPGILDVWLAFDAPE